MGDALGMYKGVGLVEVVGADEGDPLGKDDGDSLGKDEGMELGPVLG